MSIGVDPRTNSLIVSAPEALFREVKELVETLDRGAMDSNQTLEVVTLRQSSPDAVRRACPGCSASQCNSAAPRQLDAVDGPRAVPAGVRGDAEIRGLWRLRRRRDVPGRRGFPGGGFQPGGFPGGGGGFSGGGFPGGGFPGMQQGFRGGMMQGAGGPVGKRVRGGFNPGMGGGGGGAAPGGGAVRREIFQPGQRW